VGAWDAVSDGILTISECTSNQSSTVNKAVMAPWYWSECCRSCSFFWAQKDA